MAWRNQAWLSLTSLRSLGFPSYLRLQVTSVLLQEKYSGWPDILVGGTLLSPAVLSLLTPSEMSQSGD